LSVLNCASDPTIYGRTRAKALREALGIEELPPFAIDEPAAEGEQLSAET
jgi:hypothetical protein